MSPTCHSKSHSHFVHCNTCTSELPSEIWIIFSNFWSSPDRQTDRRQTDAKQCIWAHHAICTCGLKNWLWLSVQPRSAQNNLVCSLHSLHHEQIFPSSRRAFTDQCLMSTYQAFFGMFTFLCALHLLEKMTWDITQGTSAINGQWILMEIKGD